MTDTTSPDYSAAESGRITADGLRAVDEMRRCIAAIEAARDSQPERLAAARQAAAQARTDTLAQPGEQWSACMTAVPSVTRDGDLLGLFAIPTIDGKELWGTRLAFDLLAASGDEDATDAIMSDYFGMVREPDHMFLVCAAALATIVSHIVPTMLDTIEGQASDYDTRVRLADAARNAWATTIGQTRQAWDEIVAEHRATGPIDPEQAS